MGHRRDIGETTLVMPYASIEAQSPAASAPGSADSAARPLLLEAKLLWGRDTLAVRHVPARGEVRVRDLTVDVPGCDDLLVGSIDPTTRAFALRLPNGTAVPVGCRMTLRMGRALLRLALVPDDVAKLPRARRDPLVAFGILAAAVLHVVVLATIARSRGDEGETEQAARATMLRMVASAEERALSEVAAAQQKTRETRAEELAAAAAVAGTAEKEEAKAGNPSKNDGAAARARITRGDDRHATTTSDETNPTRARDHERDDAASFGILSLLAGDASSARAGSSAFARRDGTLRDGKHLRSDHRRRRRYRRPRPQRRGRGRRRQGRRGSARVDRYPRLLRRTRAKIMRPHEPGYYWVSDGQQTTQVNGRLMPEAIQRVVRQSFGRLRACYEAGLQRDPGLEGRVSVKFVIDREGAVTMAMPWADSTLPDQAVARCVVEGLRGDVVPETRRRHRHRRLPRGVHAYIALKAANVRCRPSRTLTFGS